ncbi:hypothetical protein LZ554_002976 [Drepanopeziza brunnea f. sp. 'monogermtubi']|nr:hypothetical protein LZ554_002976 [Drepanopeziza brunnea f. sp. 'monogermtubi']
MRVPYPSIPIVRPLLPRKNIFSCLTRDDVPKYKAVFWSPRLDVPIYTRSRSRSSSVAVDRTDQHEIVYKDTDGLPTNSPPPQDSHRPLCFLARQLERSGLTLDLPQLVDIPLNILWDMLGWTAVLDCPGATGQTVKEIMTPLILAKLKDLWAAESSTPATTGASTSLVAATRRQMRQRRASRHGHVGLLKPTKSRAHASILTTESQGSGALVGLELIDGS